MFHREGPSVLELTIQWLSSTQRGYDLLAPKFDYTPFRTPDSVLSVVRSGRWQFRDSRHKRRVTAFAIAPSHASDTLFTYVGGGEVIFMGDGGPQTSELRAALEDKGISVSWYAGGHGQAAAFE